MTTLSLRLSLPFLLVVAIACKKQDEPAATAGYQAGTPGAAGAPASAVPSATVPAPVTSAPAPVPSTPVPDAAAVAAVTPMLTQLAATQTVAGSKPLGSALIGNVGGGQVLEQQIMLQPSKCYSVVAVGMPPISELNAQLVALAVIPGMAPIFATDQDVGPSAVLGKKPNCYKWALPLPASVKVVISAAAGQGLAGAQVFEK